MSSSPRVGKILAWTFMAVAFVAVFVARPLVIGYYRIPQNGMYPSLPAGSTLFTFKRAYSSAKDVRRGDIIVFVREQKGQRYNYIWRVIGLPGEKIETSGQSLAINGQPVQQKRIREDDDKTIFREQIGDVSYEVAFDQSKPSDAPPDARSLSQAMSFS
jgi:signal peptidase I